MKKQKKEKKRIALSTHSSSEFPLNFPLFHFKKSRKSGTGVLPSQNSANMKTDEKCIERAAEACREHGRCCGSENMLGVYQEGGAVVV